MILYLAISKHAISLVIMVEKGKSQNLIYYTSRILKNAKTRYQMIEKLALALVTSARRLRSYSQSPRIVVQIDYPIQTVLKKPKLIG